MVRDDRSCWTAFDPFCQDRNVTISGAKRTNSPTNPAPIKHILLTWPDSCARFSDGFMQSGPASLSCWLGLRSGEPLPELGGDVSGVPRVHKFAVQASGDAVPGLAADDATDWELGGGDRARWLSRKLKDGNGALASERRRLISSELLCDNTLAAKLLLEFDPKAAGRWFGNSRPGHRARLWPRQHPYSYTSTTWNAGTVDAIKMVLRSTQAWQCLCPPKSSSSVSDNSSQLPPPISGDRPTRTRCCPARFATYRSHNLSGTLSPTSGRQMRTKTPARRCAAASGGNPHLWLYHPASSTSATISGSRPCDRLQRPASPVGIPWLLSGPGRLERPKPARSYSHSERWEGGEEAAVNTRAQAKAWGPGKELAA